MSTAIHPLLMARVLADQLGVPVLSCDANRLMQRVQGTMQMVAQQAYEQGQRDAQQPQAEPETVKHDSNT